MRIKSTKTFGHELGFSCAFRQHRAHSHCRFIHGYALGFKFVFEAEEGELSNEGWVVDFGGLKSLKGLLEGTFDHKLLVAEDDPWLPTLKGLGQLSEPIGHAPGYGPCADIVIVPATGCEAFASMVYEVTEQWLKDAGFSPRVALVSVEVSEHGANSAIVERDDLPVLTDVVSVDTSFDADELIRHIERSTKPMPTEVNFSPDVGIPAPGNWPAPGGSKPGY